MSSFNVDTQPTNVTAESEAEEQAAPLTSRRRFFAAGASVAAEGGGLLGLNSSPAFAGEGDHAKHGGGALLSPKNPSTALRAVPLPRKTGGGIKEEGP